MDCHKAFIVLSQKMKIACCEINSNITQTDRLLSLNKFQMGEIHYLLATDIASRGIDIEKVRFVINFDFPLETPKYIHRIGRTARIGYLGEAMSICNDDDRKSIKKLSRKENFTLNLIKIDNSFIKVYYKKLIETKEEVNRKIEDDLVEYELKEAEREIDHTMNMKIFKEDIFNKPRKNWYLNKKERIEKKKEVK